MKSAITHVFITVDDHDKGLDYYESVLGFNRTWDVAMDNGWRWLTVSPQGHETCNIVINKASNDAEFAIIGNQSAGDYTPVFIIETDDFQAQYEDWKAKGVNFVEEPMTMPWGIMASFRDPWGNLLLLMQSNPHFTDGRIDV
ncbi:VOC family protein [Oceanidesulfovibrio indonesiensis]|nr:VOC family protein [Oceanidesulfovibrio indonesiensis]